MAIRQLYYTSCRHPLTGRTGFQVKAISPGIAPAVVDALPRLLTYQLPPALLSAPLTAHPIALRYTPLNNSEAALMCIHSVGPDEFDRPGNYFAHAVVGPAEQIARLYPPVTYWGSPFWVQRDDTPHTELPVNDDFTAEVAFDYDAVWSFLEAGPRRAWFRALLEAVVDSAASQRRIVIVDSAYHVALWVYAVSLVLPSRFRPMLSFATYHHDPLAAPFVITGTTPDGVAAWPSGPPRFVLDAVSGAVDSAPPSTFAAYIYDHFTPDGYDSEILEFLDWAEARDDRANGITYLLNDLALFYLAARRGVGGGASASGLARAARYVLEDAARTAGAYPQDADDLRAAAAIYADLAAQSGAAEHLEGYQRALTALARTGANIADTAPAALQLYLGCVLDQRPALAASLRRTIEALYPPEVIASALNEPQLLAHLTGLLHPDNPQRIALFWQHVGPWLRLSVANQDAIVDALLTTYVALQPAPPPDPLTPPPAAVVLLDVLAAALSDKRDLALRTAHFYQQRHPGLCVLEWVYYALAAPLSLRQRAAVLWLYWAAFADIANLRTYEMQRDLNAVSDSAALALRVAEWHDVLAAAGQAAALEIALQAAWARPKLDRRRFALAALGHEPLAAALSDSWRNRLLDVALGDFSVIVSPDAATLELCRRLTSNPRLSLSAAQRAAVESALALQNGRLPSDTALVALRDRLGALDAGAYRAGVRQLLRRFFAPETHPDLVRALYVRARRDDFWALYWERFSTALLDEKRAAETAAVLDAWFARSAALVSGAPYALPEFFLQLPAALDGLRTDRRYAQVGHVFEAQLAAYDWHALVRQPPRAQGRTGRRPLGGLFDWQRKE